MSEGNPLIAADEAFWANRPKAERAAHAVARVILAMLQKLLAARVRHDLQPGQKVEISFTVVMEKAPVDPDRATKSLAHWFRHVYKGLPEPEPEITVGGGFSVAVRPE
jgi:hypothetical protein